MDSNKKPKVKINIFEALKLIFHYAVITDKILFAIGILMNALQALATPVYLFFFGEILDTFGEGQDPNQFVLYFLYLGVFAAFTGFIATFCLEFFSQNICKRMKYAYLQNILKQEIPWFDSHDPGSLTTNLNIAMTDLKSALALRLGQTVMMVVMFFGVYVVAFYLNWELTLVVSSSLVFIAICLMLILYFIGKSTTLTNEAYTEAGNIAEEALTGIRAVTSLSAQSYFENWYYTFTKKAQKKILRFTVFAVLGMSLLDGVIAEAAALCFYYGGVILSSGMANLIEYGIVPKFSPGTIIVVMFSVITAGFALGQAGSSLQTVIKGLNGVLSLKDDMYRISQIDASSEEGIKGIELKGDIEFHNVSFSYPLRPDVQIFKNLNLKIKSGQSVAFVGPSGIGKSTVILLLQRFYDPSEGYITIDGTPLKDFNLKFLRSKLGVVSQHPLLFSDTIKNNILLGTQENVGNEELEEVCKNSLAHDFIMKFPSNYSTFVGEGGGQLSGGQKQRIAIARALIRKPRFLLFDEATSALDNRSEKLVQVTLDKLMEERSRTCIIVAHRLTTVKNSDQIIVFHKPGSYTEIAQSGTHEELMQQKDGVFYNLMNSQTIEQISSEGDDTDNYYDMTDSDFNAVNAKEAQAGGIPPTMGANTEIETVDSYMPTEKQRSKKGPKRRKATRKEAMEFDPTGPASYMQKHSFLSLLKFMIADLFYMIAGSISALFSGVTYPAMGYVMSSYLSEIFTPDPDLLSERANFWSLIMALIGVYAVATSALRLYFFEVSGINLVQKLRSMIFHSFLSQEIEFFDHPEHSVGKLTSVLSSDVQLVKLGSGTQLGTVLNSVSIAIVGVIIASIENFKLAAVTIALFLAFAPANYFENQFYLLGGLEFKSKLENIEKPETILFESISQIRNVMTLGIEKNMLKRYITALNRTNTLYQAAITGAVWAYSQGGQFFVNAGAYYYGNTLISAGEIGYTEMFRVLFVVTFATMGLAQAASFFSDLAKSAEARNRVFSLIYKPSKINPFSEEGEKIDFKSAELDKVSFVYTNRPEIKVLNQISFHIHPGKTHAIVGESGCGKSTIIQLLERFYDCNQEEVAISLSENAVSTQSQSGGLYYAGKNIKDTNIKHTRGQLGLVSQDPILFNTSVFENIKLGHPSATEEEVIQAAKISNAHSFIDDFPEKYDTIVGRMGGKLSGGQKQRIVIARSIIKNPNLLLLDEATASLDNESERLVQSALDSLVAEHPRTTVIVAHRFSTIRNADRIIVLKASENVNGSYIAEAGTHDELLANKGEYFKLYSSQ